MRRNDPGIVTLTARPALPMLAVQCHPGSRRPRLAGAACLFAIAAALSACQSGTPLSPESKAILANPPDKPPPVVTRTASNSAIPVLVNDVPITAYDITQRIRLNQLGGASPARKAVIDELIDETLKGQEAGRRHISVPDEQIEAAFAQIARQVKMTPTSLTKALSGRGIDADTLKKRLRAQMTWQQLVQARAIAEGTVKNQDVTAQLIDKGDPEKMTLTRYTLQQIVFVVPAGSSTAAYTQRRREAEAFRLRFAGCDKSLEQAQRLKGVVVKSIGRRDGTELVGPQGDLIKKTPPGKTAPPDQIEGGIELIAVCAKQDIQTTAATRAEVENSLFLKQAEDLGKDYLKELRDRAVIVYR